MSSGCAAVTSSASTTRSSMPNRTSSKLPAAWTGWIGCRCGATSSSPPTPTDSYPRTRSTNAAAPSANAPTAPSREPSTSTVSGHALKTAIDHETQRLLDEDAQAGISRSGTERTADALTRVVMRGAARPSGDLPTPLIHITLGKQLADDMVKAATHIDGDDIALLSDPNDINRWCELADGTPLHPHHAMSVLAVAEFTRLVLDPDSAMLDLGDSTRCFPKDMHLSSIRLRRSNG